MEYNGENIRSRRYSVETQQQYAIWLNTFEVMLTRTERYGKRSICDNKCRQHYVTMINSLKKSMRHQEKCYVVEDDQHIFCRYNVVCC